MNIQEAMLVWEGVLEGKVGRMDERFIESIRLFGRTIRCGESELVSDVFVRAGLCSSKGDFRRSISGLKLDEQPVQDGPIGKRVLLRKGKNMVVLVTNVPVV